MPKNKTKASAANAPVSLPPGCLESRGTMRKYLESLGEPSYLRFASSLIPELPVEWFLGIRLPLLRKVARRIAADRWEEYTVRFGAVLLLDYYVDRAYLEEALAELERVDHDSYYVKMAVAWALSMFYLEFPKETGAFLADCRLDDFTYHKALQKICESRRADREMKERVRTMRRKSGEGQEGKS